MPIVFVALVWVLRLGHRRERDKRLTTHCALVSRALGAQKFWYTGDKDSSLEESVRLVAEKWGGKFEVSHAESWRSVVSAARKTGCRVAHLTMYGEPFEKAKLKPPLLLVVGGKKVPWRVFEESDVNVSVTSQPHSEAAALAIVLYSLGLKPDFSGWSVKVEPNPRGKTVLGGSKKYK